MVHGTVIPVAGSVVERLAAHRTLSAAPRAELEWLAARGTVHHYDAGSVMTATGETATEMVVILTGRIGVHLQRGTGHRHLFEFGAGDVGGVLP